MLKELVLSSGEAWKNAFFLMVEIYQTIEYMPTMITICITPVALSVGTTLSIQWSIVWLLFLVQRLKLW